MICHINSKQAEEMGISAENALLMRQNFLRQRKWEVAEEIEITRQYPCCNDWEYIIAALILVDMVKESIQIRKELREIDRMLLKIKPVITPDMIERAKSTPIETVIEFKRGVARCINPEHADRNPSMFHGKKTNRAVCPVCNKSWDAIEAYRYIFGVSFYDAVKNLC